MENIDFNLIAQIAEQGWAVIAAIIGTASVVAMVWKKPENNNIFKKLHAVVNVLAANIGNAKNKE